MFAPGGNLAVAAQTIDPIESEAIAADPRYAELFAAIRNASGDEAVLETSVELMAYVAQAYQPDDNLYLQTLDQTFDVVNYLDLEGRYSAFMRQLYVEAFPAVARRLGPDHALSRILRRRRDSALESAGLIDRRAPDTYEFLPGPRDFAALPSSPPQQVTGIERQAIATDARYAELFSEYQEQRTTWQSDAAWLQATMALLRYVERTYTPDSEIYLRTLARATLAVRAVDYDRVHVDLVSRLSAEALPAAQARLGQDNALVRQLAGNLENWQQDAERQAMFASEDLPSEFDWRLDTYDEPARSELRNLFEKRADLSGDALVENLVTSRDLELREIGAFRPYPLYFATRELLRGMTEAGRYDLVVEEAARWLDALGDDNFGQSDMEVTVIAYLANAQAALGNSDLAAEALARAVLAPDLNEVPPEQLYPWQPGSDPVEREYYLPQARSQLARILLRADTRSALALDSARFAIRYLRGVRDNRPPGAEANAVIADQFSAPEDLPFGQDARQQFSGFVEAAWRLAQENGDADKALFAEAFAAAQDALQDRATRAVAQNAASEFAARAGFGELARQREAISREIASLARDGMAGSREYRQAVARQEDIDWQLQQAAPEFFRLIRPRALPLAEARALLGQGEAVVLVLPTEYGTHVMAVTPEGEAWHKSDLTADEVAGSARRLREDLDPWGAGVISYWDAGFEAGAAHDLFRELIEPVMPVLAASDALLYATGPELASIPLTVLVAAAPDTAGERHHDYRAMSWLGDRFAMAQLPSIASLAFLRTNVKTASRQRSIVGFADPILEGEAATRGGRNAGSVASTRIALSANGRDGPPLADPASIRALARLPGTAQEVRMLAQSLQQGSEVLYLGASATESSVKDEDLSNVRFLAFATHGLKAGEGGIASEPGLVFTPPEEATMHDDGLLTASEILTLDLSADWVMLSACNTAAADGLGGGSLSGLARSFFFAGARSLLASHWPVRDDVAPLLTSGAVRMLAENPGMSRGTALQLAMIDVRNDESLEFADHPSSWAPFITVGDLR
ncbi:CHAT domain-containing protein [Erythrobacter sp.]|uniref:CHAT domain-containing protein n=1 Tax=Erythrobacter sp. TaxID=1042 RepID=UPI001425FBA3|nr:CHAT domain-containing protein [Erythrobacter sp.]QIQ86036.1 MAG: CHAT domain-containing protein [Erythrobacter sp.]